MTGYSTFDETRHGNQSLDQAMQHQAADQQDAAKHHFQAALEHYNAASNKLWHIINHHPLNAVRMMQTEHAAPALPSQRALLGQDIVHQQALALLSILATQSHLLAYDDCHDEAARQDSRQKVKAIQDALLTIENYLTDPSLTHEHKQALSAMKDVVISRCDAHQQSLEQSAQPKGPSTFASLARGGFFGNQRPQQAQGRQAPPSPAPSTAATMTFEEEEEKEKNMVQLNRAASESSTAAVAGSPSSPR